jgi:dipeptidase
MAQRKAYEPEEDQVEQVAIEDEKYLSAATLARLKELSFDEDEEGTSQDLKQAVDQDKEETEEEEEKETEEENEE